MLARRPPKDPRLGSCVSAAADTSAAFAPATRERPSRLSAALTFPSIHRLTVMSQCPLPYVRSIVPGASDRDAASSPRRRTSCAFVHGGLPHGSWHPLL